MNLDILYEDNHLLVVNKPAGLPTMGVSEQLPSMVRWAKQYLKRKYVKPGNVYLGVVSRLDAAASGSLVLARTSKAAARLAEQFREHRVKKTYWALVEGFPDPPNADCHDWLLKDDAAQRMKVVGPGIPNAQSAELSYQRLAVFENFSLLEIALKTGRKHQIRVQLASRHFPIVGDRKYGSRAPFGRASNRGGPGIVPPVALHARELQIEHPTRPTSLCFLAPLPSLWRSAGVTEPPA